MCEFHKIVPWSSGLQLAWAQPPCFNVAAWAWRQNSLCKQQIIVTQRIGSMDYKFQRRIEFHWKTVAKFVGSSMTISRPTACHQMLSHVFGMWESFDSEVSRCRTPPALKILFIYTQRLPWHAGSAPASFKDRPCIQGKHLLLVKNKIKKRLRIWHQRLCEKWGLLNKHWRISSLQCRKIGIYPYLLAIKGARWVRWTGGHDCAC